MKKEDYKSKYSIRESGLFFLLLVVLPQLAIITISLFLNVIGVTSKMLNDSIIGIIYQVFISQLLFIILFLLYNFVSKTNIIKANKFTFKIKWWKAVVIVFIALIGLFGFSSLINVFDALVKKIGYSNDFTLPIPGDTIPWFLASVLFLAIIPAIVEEFIFRGLIFNGLKKIGVHKTIFITAFLFALFHGSVSQFLYQFLLGVMLGYVLIGAKTLFAPIIMHFTNNFTVVLIRYITESKGASNSSNNFDFLKTNYVIAAVIISIISALIIYLLIKYVILRNKEKQNSELVEIQNDKFEKKDLNLLVIGGLISLVLWITDFIAYLK